MPTDTVGVPASQQPRRSDAQHSPAAGPRLTVLALLPYYLPGYTSGGPIRSMVGLVDRLGDEMHFRIVTSASDPRDPAAYEGVRVGQWQRVGKAEVFYAPPDVLTFRGLRTLLAQTPHDVLYLNSLYAPRFTILPLVLRRMGGVPAPVVVAPRGELSAGARAIKRTKKRAYLALARALGLLDGVLWQASSRFEEAEVHEWFGPAAAVRVAPNLMAATAREEEAPWPEKESGRLRVAFLARVARMKNLDTALRALARAEGAVTFDVYGTREDAAYWAECEALMEALPPHVHARYRGAVQPEDVHETLRSYDLFLLPTHGENFGHAIVEALAAGCPILISDRTPWRDLQRHGVGWDVALEDPDALVQALRQAVALDAEAHTRMRHAAVAYAREVQEAEEAVEQNRRLFHTAATRAAS